LIADPGAIISITSPKLEYEARVSVIVLAATVIAFREAAGLEFSYQTKHINE
jgi:hypothetical protein